MTGEVPQFAQPQEPDAYVPGEGIRRRMLADREQGNKLMLESYRQSLASDPTYAANIQRLARRRGLPTDALSDLKPNQVRELIAMEQLELRDLATHSPILAEQLKDRSFAQIAHDDLDNLQGIEGWFEEMRRNYRAGELTSQRGTLGDLWRQIEDQKDPTLIDRAIDATRLQELPAEDEVVRQLASVQRRLRSLPAESSGFTTGTARTLGQLSEGLPTVMTTATIGAATGAALGAAGGPLAPVTATAGAVKGLGIGAIAGVAAHSAQVEAGNAYVDMRAAGYDRQAASQAAFGVGIFNGLMEATGGAIGGAIATKPVRDALRRRLSKEIAEAMVDPTLARRLRRLGWNTLKATGGEIGTETVQELSNIVGEVVARSETLSLDPSARNVIGFDESFQPTEGDLEQPLPAITSDEVLERLHGIIVQTLYGTALLGGASAGSQFLSDTMRARQAQQSFESMQQAASFLQASKLAERDPERAEEFFQQAAENAPDMFIDGERFNQVLEEQQVPLEQIEAEIPGIAAKLDEAVRTGGAIEINAGDFQRIARREIGQALLPHVRVTADAYSAVEAEELLQNEEERAEDAREAFEQSEDFEEQFRESGAEVERVVRARLEGVAFDLPKAMNRTAAQAHAALWRAGYEVLARELGELPADVAQRFGVTVKVKRRDLPDVGPDLLQNEEQPDTKTAKDAQAQDAQRAEPSETADQPPVTKEEQPDAQDAQDAQAQSEQTQDDELRSGSRGKFNPRTRTITLHENANLSTFLHESAHFWLSLYTDMAASPDAPVQLRERVEGLLNKFGVESIEAWQAMSLEQQRKHHERFALNFEQYMADGKAPTPTLQRWYDKFAGWLRKVYEAIAGQLNATYRRDFGEDLPALTGEVRDFMDRLFASEQQVQHAAAESAFESQEQSGMDDAAWADYQATVQEARDAASSELARRSLKELRQLRARERELRRTMRNEVAEEVAQDPVYRAMRWLRRGETVDESGEVQRETGQYRLNTAAVRRILPSGTDLRNFGGGNLTSREGLPPDVVAGMFEFETGEALVKALAAAPRRDDAIDARLQERIEAEHAELTDDAAKLQAAVDQALRNGSRQRLVQLELRALSGSVGPVSQMLRAAKAAAETAIAERPIGSIRPYQFTLAERRARREATEAIARGDVPAAAAAKRREALQQQMAAAATKAREEIEKAETLFKRFNQPDSKLGKDRDVNIVAAGRALLASNRLGPQRPRSGVHGPDADGVRGNGPHDWKPHLEAVTEYDEATARDLSEVIGEAEFHPDSRADLTLAQLREVYRVAKALWEKARDSKQAEVDGERVALAQVAGEIVEQVQKTFGEDRRDPNAPIRPLTKAEERQWSFGSVKASIRHFESFAVRVDGGRPGVMHKHMFAPLRDAHVDYLAERNDVVKTIHDGLNKLDLPSGQIEAPELNGHVFANKAELLGALLDMGNESNLRKRLLGSKWVPQPRERDGPINTAPFWAFFERMIEDRKITKADVDFLQLFWNSYHERFERTQKVHFEVYGYQIPQLDRRSFQTPWGVYEGGYVPAKPDPKQDPSALARGDGDVSVHDTASPIPSTGRDFAHQRVEVNRSLVSNIRERVEHFDEHLRFLHMQKPGRQVWRLLQNKELRDELNRIDPHIIPGIIRPWIKDTLLNRVMKPGVNRWLDKILVTIRRNVGQLYMMGNVANAAQQATGLVAAGFVAPLRNAKAASAKFVSNPREYVQRVIELSKFMDLRLVEQMGQIVDDIDVVLKPNLLSRSQHWMSRNAYFLQRLIQSPVDVITWGAVYDHATETGKSQKDAVQEADSAVRRTQGSGLAPDLSAAERAGALGRMLTQFGSIWFVFWNLTLEGQTTPLRIQRFATLTAFMGVGAAAITQALRGGWDDEDADGALMDDVTRWAFGEAVQSGAAIGAPVVGPMLSRMLFDERSRGRLSFGASMGAIETAGRGLRASFQLLTDGTVLDSKPDIAREVKGRDIRDIFTLFGLLLGAPPAAAVKPFGFLRDVERGEVQPTSDFDYWRGLVTGSASPGSR